MASPLWCKVKFKVSFTRDFHVSFHPIIKSVLMSNTRNVGHFSIFRAKLIRPNRIPIALGSEVLPTRKDTSTLVAWFCQKSKQSTDTEANVHEAINNDFILVSRISQVEGNHLCWFVSYFGNESLQTNLGNVQASFYRFLVNTVNRKRSTTFDYNALPKFTFTPPSSSF